MPVKSRLSGKRSRNKLATVASERRRTKGRFQREMREELGQLIGDKQKVMVIPLCATIVS